MFIKMDERTLSFIEKFSGKQGKLREIDEGKLVYTLLFLCSVLPCNRLIKTAAQKAIRKLVAKLRVVSIIAMNVVQLISSAGNQNAGIILWEISVFF